MAVVDSLQGNYAMVTNEDVVHTLDWVADLLVGEGENVFRAHEVTTR